MYKTLSTGCFLGCAGWLGWVFHRKSLALTNLDFLDLLAWAWREQHDGVMLCFIFALLWMCSLVFMASTLQRVLSLLLGQVQSWIYVGDELLNRYQRYYREDDPLRKVAQLPGTAGSPLKFSYPTRMDGFFRREYFLANGSDPEHYTHIDDCGLLPVIAFSLFFYFSLSVCIAVLHAMARDYMVGQDRVVTPFDTVIEFLVIISILLALNFALLIVQYVACRVKLPRKRQRAVPPGLSLELSPGDRVQAKLLDKTMTGNSARDSGVVGSQAAYYLVKLDSPLGIPVTACFRFGFSNSQRAAVDAFEAKLLPGASLECVVTDTLSLRPAALLAAGVDWFD